jgi:hypothetical protein
MRRFLVCSGINGQATALDMLETVIRERKPDGVFFAGGVLCQQHECTPTFETEFGLAKEEALFIEHFFGALGRLGVFSAIIPGVLDAPLDQFLRIGMKAELEYPCLHLVHATPVVEQDVAIFGLGARIDGYTNADIGYYSQTMAAYYLRPLWTVAQPRTILLLSDYLEGWHGDNANRRLTEALIATFHPQVCVLGTPCASRGCQRFASTLLISPGYLSQGSAAELDWNRSVDDQVKILDLAPTVTLLVLQSAGVDSA